MQNQARKFAFTPWKKPENWLNSFRPGNTLPAKDALTYRVNPIVVNKNKLRSNIDMTSNKLEYQPGFSTSMREAFISRHQFSDNQRWVFFKFN